MATRTRDRDVQERESIVAEIVYAVAETEGIDPLSLTPPLADVIDPEALEAVVADSRTLTELQFEYRDWEVTVHPDGAVSLADAGGRATDRAAE